jgi:hypothetical protein
MTARIHYACDGTWFDCDEGCYEQVPACGNDFHGRKRLSDDPDDITCPTCRELCGFASVGIVEEEQLTEVHGDPFGERFAA